MTSVFKPLKSINSLILAGIMATTALAATAQPLLSPEPAVSAAPAISHAGERDHRQEKMQAHAAKRMAKLKTELAITPAQEGAWSNFTAAMQPAAHRSGDRPDRKAMHAEFEKLTTPQRIDKMRAMRTERMATMTAAMDQREEATKNFYAALTAEQQKTFDAKSMRMGPMGHGERHGNHDRG
jgi:protein CpxP